jgi:4-hydroxy-tetrahydrodipicolinate synthase
MVWEVRGSFVALVTPFDRKGRIDGKCLENLCLWHVEQGTDGIVCFGTTGEGIALSEAEKKKVVAICIAAVGKKIPVIASTGTSSTKQTVLLTEQMGKIGADGALVVTPYYNKPTQRGCVLHFGEVAKVGLPIIVYNNPKRTGLLLEPKTVAEIGRISGICGYKDSTGDLELIRKIRQISSIPLFSGDDDLTYSTLLAGGAGAISVVGNLIPKAWKKMISLALEGKWEPSKKIADSFYPLCEALFLESNPQCVKFAVSQLGKCRQDLRLPLIPPTEKTQEQIKKVLLDFRSQLGAT